MDHVISTLINGQVLHTRAMNWSGKKQGAVSWPQSQVVHTLEYGQLSQPITAYLREIIDININSHTKKKLKIW